MFEVIELSARRIDGVDGWNVSRTEWRLDLLPTKRTPPMHITVAVASFMGIHVMRLEISFRRQ